MNNLIYILIIFLNVNYLFSNLLQKDSQNSLLPPAPENDHILIGINYNFNFNSDIKLNSKMENNLINNNLFNTELNIRYMTDKIKSRFYIGYEFFRYNSELKLSNIENSINYKIVNDFILLKYSFFRRYPVFTFNRLSTDIQSEIGIGYMPYSEFSFHNKNDENILKEENIIERRKLNYPLNYKIGAEINIGYIPEITIFGQNIILNSSYKVEYYYKPTITKKWNFRIELELIYCLDLGE